MIIALDATSTADDVLAGADLTGRRALVTGVSAGLGVETARALAARGAHVVGAARDLAKAHRATERIRAEAAAKGSLELVELDLADLESVRRCTDGVVAAGEPFDLVVANAGLSGVPKGLTKDGFETHFGINHLGHFVLVNRISDLMGPGSRLVCLSSSAHRVADVDLDDPGFAHTPYSETAAYGRSKTANCLFAVEFDRRRKAGGVRAAAVHPGGIQTELLRHMTRESLAALIEEMDANRPAGAPEFAWKSVPQGAATTVWAGIVAAPGEVGGRYCEDCHVAEVVDDDPSFPDGVRSYALDPDRARQLWALSERMVGERF